MNRSPYDPPEKSGSWPKPPEDSLHPPKPTGEEEVEVNSNLALILILILGLIGFLCVIAMMGSVR